MMYRRLSCFLLATVSAGLIATSASAQETAEPGNDTEQAEDFAQDFERLIDTAINEGLLQSTGTTEPDTSGQGRSSAALVRACSGQPWIDFSDYQALRLYSDILPYRDQVPLEEDDGFADAQRVYVGALVSMGLYDEARREFPRLKERDREVFLAISDLLQVRQSADSALISGIDACYNRELWRGIAQLTDRQPEGVRRFSNQMTAFREIPYQMRVGILANVSPALISLDGQLIAEQAMSTFTIEEIEASKALTFIKTVLDFGRTGGIDRDLLQDYLADPFFRTEALRLLTDVGSDEDRLIDQVPLSQLNMVLQSAASDRDIEYALAASLRILAKRPDFQSIADLADETALADERWQQTIISELGDRLKASIENDALDAALKALDLMLAETDLLQAYYDRDGLYIAAIERAEAEGYPSLAQELSDIIGYDNPTNEAKLAFAQGEKTRLYLLADQHPEDAGINLYAARMAIAEGDRVLLREFESRVDQAPETLFTLIEADTLSGNWLVSDQVWQLAQSIEDDALAAQAAQMSRIREASRYAGQGRTRIPIDQAGSVLSRSRDWLNTQVGEGR